MARVTLQGNPVNTVGELPPVDGKAPAFTLTNTDLGDVALADHKGKSVVLNVFPSIDTSVCAASVRRFNQEAASRPDTVVLCISADLPFAHKRFCEAEGLERVHPLSVFRSPEFGADYGLTITDGPLRGLLARAVLLIDRDGTVLYWELVPEITQEPDYETALAFLGKLGG